MSNKPRKKTKSRTPQSASPILLLSGPKVMYDEMGRILIESMVGGNLVQQVLDTSEPIVQRALIAIGWVPPGNNVEKAAYESVAAIIGAGATFQEVVDFLMVKLGLDPQTPELTQSEVKHRHAVAQMQKDFGHHFRAILHAKTPEAELEACRALAKAVGDDFDKAMAEGAELSGAERVGGEPGNPSPGSKVH